MVLFTFAKAVPATRRTDKTDALQGDHHTHFCVLALIIPTLVN